MKEETFESHLIRIFFQNRKLKPKNKKKLEVILHDYEKNTKSYFDWDYYQNLLEERDFKKCINYLSEFSKSSQITQLSNCIFLLKKCLLCSFKIEGKYEEIISFIGKEVRDSKDLGKELMSLACKKRSSFGKYEEKELQELMKQLKSLHSKISSSFPIERSLKENDWDLFEQFDSIPNKDNPRKRNFGIAFPDSTNNEMNNAKKRKLEKEEKEFTPFLPPKPRITSQRARINQENSKFGLFVTPRNQVKKDSSISFNNYITPKKSISENADNTKIGRNEETPINTIPHQFPLFQTPKPIATNTQIEKKTTNQNKLMNTDSKLLKKKVTPGNRYSLPLTHTLNSVEHEENNSTKFFRMSPFKSSGIKNLFKEPKKIKKKKRKSTPTIAYKIGNSPLREIIRFKDSKNQFWVFLNDKIVKLEKIENKFVKLEEEDLGYTDFDLKRNIQLTKSELFLIIRTNLETLKVFYILHRKELPFKMNENKSQIIPKEIENFHFIPDDPNLLLVISKKKIRISKYDDLRNHFIGQYEFFGDNEPINSDVIAFQKEKKEEIYTKLALLNSKGSLYIWNTSISADKTKGNFDLNCVINLRNKSDPILQIQKEEGNLKFVSEDIIIAFLFNSLYFINIRPNRFGKRKVVRYNCRYKIMDFCVDIESYKQTGNPKISVIYPNFQVDEFAINQNNERNVFTYSNTVDITFQKKDNELPTLIDYDLDCSFLVGTTEGNLILGNGKNINQISSKMTLIKVIT